MKSKQTLKVGDEIQIDRLGRPRIKGKIIFYAVKNGKKYCAGCKKILPIDKFYKKTLNTFQSQCKDCQAKIFKNWKKNHLEYFRDGAKKYRVENPLKINARNRARLLKNKGLIISNCSICGSDKNIEKHHPDYNMPDYVIFLCSKCHHKLHVILKNENKNL